MTEAAFWFVHSVSVETYLGQTASGPSFAPPVVVPCWVEDGRRLLTSATTDQTVAQPGRIFAALDTVPAVPPAAGQFTPQSRVTVNGRIASVITVERFDSGSLDIGLDHIEVSVT